MMKFLVRSTNSVKIQSVLEAAKSCKYFSGRDLEVHGISVSSGVSDQPLNFIEVLEGAKNRAQNLRDTGEVADYYIGIEGGTQVIGDKAYLFGITYIISASGQAHFGTTLNLEVPDYFQEGIYEDGKNLSNMQDELNGIENAGEKNGSFGVWSDDMLTRQGCFKDSFTAAIVPFYNTNYTI